MVKFKELFIYHESNSIKAPYGTILLIVALFNLAIAFSVGVLPNYLGRSYNHYSELPEPFKSYVLNFKHDAKLRNKDSSLLEKMKFKVSPTPFPIAPYKAACDKNAMLLLLPKNSGSEAAVYHELGHCVFNFEHSPDPTHLMHYDHSSGFVFNETSKDTFFSYQSFTSQNIDPLEFIKNSPWNLIRGFPLALLIAGVVYGLAWGSRKVYLHLKK